MQRSLCQFIILVATVVFVTTTVPAFAEEPEPRPISPAEAIARAATASDGVVGVFEFTVQATGEQDGFAYLNSEPDYRDPKNLSVVFPPEVRASFVKANGTDPRSYFMGKRVRVMGIARRVPVYIYSHGRVTERFYYQTHIRLRHPPEIQLAAATQPSVPPSSAPQNALYLRLIGHGSDAVAALHEVLAKPESMTAVVLFMASGVALREKQLEDAAFLFYIARFRARFDNEVFPPTGKGGDNPMVLFAALNSEVGNAVNPEIMAHPEEFARVLARVKGWAPRVDDTYNPGWDFARRLPDAEAATALRARMNDFLDHMGGMCTLLQDQAYFAAFRTVQDFNLKQGSNRPSQADYDAAMKTLEQIETKKGIRGITDASKQEK